MWSCWTASPTTTGWPTLSCLRECSRHRPVTVQVFKMTSLSGRLSNSDYIFSHSRPDQFFWSKVSLGFDSVSLSIKLILLGENLVHPKIQSFPDRLSDRGLLLNPLWNRYNDRSTDTKKYKRSGMNFISLNESRVWNPDCTELALSVAPAKEGMLVLSVSDTVGTEMSWSHQYTMLLHCLHSG